MSEHGELVGKRCLVTGCSRGIGEAIALALARAGADVVGTSRQGPGSAVADAISAEGRSFEGHAVDFSDRHSVVEFANLMREDGLIDILVNNAGTIMRAPAESHQLDWWDEVIEVNLSSQFILTQAVGQSMLERGQGKVIFIASLLSFQGGINVPGYTASKSAIAGLTRALANEWAGRGVNVNAIAPGYIATDNTETLRNDPARFAAITDRIPAGRWGTPQDLVGPALFLASDRSAYVHGAVLTVDGGWMGR